MDPETIEHSIDRNSYDIGVLAAALLALMNATWSLLDDNPLLVRIKEIADELEPAQEERDA